MNPLERRRLVLECGDVVIMTVLTSPPCQIPRHMFAREGWGISALIGLHLIWNSFHSSHRKREEMELLAKEGRNFLSTGGSHA